MKLNIGANNNALPGWTNLDIIQYPNVDIVDNAKILKKIEDCSCDIIYASHVLEHFGRHEIKDVLKTWVSKLKVGGILRIAVPNFESVVKVYNKNENIQEVLGLVSGGQRNEYDYHKCIFDKVFLSEILYSIGLRDIKEWDWRLTDHKDVDDYSQSYLPHMDKENGQLMSLNLEGIKK